MNRKIILKQRPVGEPKKDDFELIQEEIQSPKESEVLLKTIYMSLDPYMRGRMNDAKSYAKAVEIGEEMEAGAVSQVIESNSANFKVGDFVEGRTGWQDNPTVNEKKLRKIDSSMAPLSTAIGVLGMPGTTAYVGMKNFAKPQKGETLVVSAASGAVGGTVGQIGKIHGCKVIGIAGSDEKCEFTKQEYNFDECLNYKDPNFKDNLRDVCKNGVDIYWENVGGKTFNAVYPHFRDFARIPVCGVISMYNNQSQQLEEDRLPMLFRNVLTWRLRIQGFIVSEFPDQKLEAMQHLEKWYLEGKLKYREDVVEGLDNMVEAFQGLLRGDNFGKLLIKVN